MKNIKKPIKTMVSLAVVAMITSHTASAGGFSLYTESGAAAIGNYAAGIAAEGADASIGWYNPAGLILIKKQQVVLGGVGVFPSTQLTGVSNYVTQNPTGGVYPPYIQSFSNLQGGENAVVPSLHYALPLGDRATFGLSLVSPFGLSTNYDKNSAVRYAATESKFETFNVSPELGGKLTDNWSIGAGLDLQYARVHFNSVIGAPALFQEFQQINPDIQPQAADSSSNNVGDSFGVGFHAGTMLMFNDQHTRLGFNYQSAINHTFYGSSTLTGRLADPSLFILEPELANPNASYSTNSLYSNAIDLPAIMTLSAYQDVTSKFALLGSVVYSSWSSFKSITLNNIAVGIPNIDDTTLTQINSTINENYHDAWRAALGANYHVTDKWMMRVGGGYDQTPTDNAHRDVRLPDSNRWALSVGSHYQATPSIGVDVGYTYLFAAQDGQVDYTLDLLTSTDHITATAKNRAQLFGLQAVWSIG